MASKKVLKQNQCGDPTAMNATIYCHFLYMNLLMPDVILLQNLREHEQKC